MTTYKSIRGLTVQAVATDPEVYAGSWSSGNNLNTARSRAGGSTQATQTAGIVFGAADPPYGQTEEYNGTSWSNQENMNGGRYISYGGGGTQTATITAGGYDPAGSPQYQTVLSETYNGTSWTEVNELNTGRIDCTTFGTSTAALLVGGGSAAGGPGTVANVESWNGTSWSETTDIPATRQEMAGWGLATAGAIVGGSQDSNPTMTAETLEYNGSSWTAGGDYSSVVKYFTAFGTADNGIAAGGSTGSANLTVAANYNGTAWTEVAELASVRRGNMSNGASGTSGLTAGGETPAGNNMNVTEEWAFPSSPVVQLGQVWYNTASTTYKAHVQQGTGAWASGGALPTANRSMGTFGTQSSAIAGGGGTPAPSSTQAYSYNGTSWTEITELNATKNEGVGFGNSATSGFINRGTNEEWDGSSWTERADLNTSRFLASASGTSTASLMACGETGSGNNVETWDGSSWTETTETNQGRFAGAMSGTQTSSIIAGGNSFPPPTTSGIDNSETWNGTSWSEGSDLNNARTRMGSAGTSVPTALVFGGASPPSETARAYTESYNGSSWTEVGDMGTARRSIAAGMAGTGLAALATGGLDPSATTATEEWTVASGTKTLSVA